MENQQNQKGIKIKNENGKYTIKCACGCGMIGEVKSAKAIYLAGHKNGANQRRDKQKFKKVNLFIKNYKFNARMVIHFFENNRLHISKESLIDSAFDFKALPCPAQNKDGCAVFEFENCTLTALGNGQFLIGKIDE